MTAINYTTGNTGNSNKRAWIARSITITASYVALVDTPCVATFTLSAAPGNSGAVYIQGDNESDDVAIQPGEWHVFHNIDLNEIKVKGTADDVVTVIGGNWS